MTNEEMIYSKDWGLAEVLMPHRLEPDLYHGDALEDVMNYLAFNMHNFRVDTSEWPDCSGGTCAICWTTCNGTLNMIMFDYKKGGYN